MGMSEIIIKGLCFAYDGRQVINNLNLRLESDEKTVLLGRSGRGKTTLLRLILGLIKPCGGSIELRGIKSAAVMFQEDRLFPQLNVYKNLQIVKKDLKREQAGLYLSELGLDSEVLDRLPGELSGGMKRRVALIRALIYPSDLLLLDEPFQGLDKKTRALALGAVNKYAEDRLTLVVSHEAEDAAVLSARTVTMEKISEGCAVVE